jgi:hypothetical protein
MIMIRERIRADDYHADELMNITEYDLAMMVLKNTGL